MDTFSFTSPMRQWSWILKVNVQGLLGHPRSDFLHTYIRNLPCRNYTKSLTSRSEETPLMATADAIKTPAVDLRAHTYGTFEGSDDSKWRRNLNKTQAPKVFTKRVIVLIVALGIFTYHSMTFDHLMPIFFEDERRGFSSMVKMAEPTLGINPFFFPGGLGLSVQQVGFIMMVNGAIALFVQAVCIFSMSNEKWDNS